ncbi:MAG: pyrroloquinoline quinone biosynthesis peptide chaperone PqqD [alpha proteobacterium MED-G10]|jgi:pyrroloquinoline quinone biosynthesis protein D|nr:MAG: pyrroloquinoline quinone biosynthesis peptide chaperone PqqD [alpha proteobacterium MED-G10]|tara:strand:- start:3611 stop:3907 length:297 start_codon:yes stop_codon:yes gene_type:complete
MTDILKIEDETVPRFPKHVKFRHNKARDEWVILAPERLVNLDQIAVEILKMVDGEKKVKEISAELSKKFNAPEETIISDVKEMLQDLSDKGFIEEKNG